MRKLNIQTILLIGFSIIALLILISGMRELVVLDKLNNLRTTELQTNKIENFILENKTIFRSENSILNSINSTDDQTIFNDLKTEHENNVRLINENFNKLFRLINVNSDYLSTNEITSLSVILKKAETLYTKEYLSDYNQIINNKYKLLNIETAFIEQLSINQIISKERLIKDLNDDIFDLNTQINSSSELINQQIFSFEQKNQLFNLEIEETINNNFKRAEKIAFLFIFIILVFLGGVLILNNRVILKPISKLKKQLNRLTKGELPENIDVSGGVEIMQIGIALNKLVTGLKRGADFSLEIGKGNFDTSFKPLSENDVLGDSLLTLRENLKSAQDEDQKRKDEDAQRNRTNEGLTMFSQILRQQTGNISELADDIISSLVKFMNANQGGLFFLNEDDHKNVYYELIGAYAYNRKKYISKQIKPGEGLVGSVAIEKYTIYMTDVPDEYIEIESGLGSANPRSILVVPLKIEEQVLGVIEIASFNTFERYEVEMLEKIAESIAASLANARINIQTASLLERSKDQEKLMIEQEKELEQNLDEIKRLTNKLYELDSELEKYKKKEKE